MSISYTHSGDLSRPNKEPDITVEGQVVKPVEYLNILYIILSTLKESENNKKVKVVFFI